MVGRLNNKMNSESKLIKYITVGAAICLAIYVGRSIAETGKVQVRIITLCLPFIFFWVQNLNDQQRFRLLLVGIPLIALQTSKLPFRLSLSEVILLTICLAELPILQVGGQHISKTINGLSILIPYCMFAACGFINGIINGGISIAQQVCLVPLLWMYVAMVLVNTPEDAFKMIRMAVFGVLGCFCFLWIANQLGFAITESMAQYRTVGESISIGPFYYIYTPLRFGTMIALAIPATLILFITSEEHGSRLLYALILTLFAGLSFKATGRGASIAALCGSSVIGILLYRRYAFKITAIGLMAIICFVIVGSGSIGAKLIQKLRLEKNRSEYAELFVYGLRVHTLQDRIDTLKFTIENTVKNPIGNGFQYLFRNYGIDEAIMYSVLLNGTGIIGFISYMFMIGHLLLHFIRCLTKSFSEDETNLAVLGIATLVCALLAGISSESVVWNEFNPFILWVILAACYCGTRNTKQRRTHRNQSSDVSNPVEGREHFVIG